MPMDSKHNDTEKGDPELVDSSKDEKSLESGRFSPRQHCSIVVLAFVLTSE